MLEIGKIILINECSETKKLRLLKQNLMKLIFFKYETFKKFQSKEFCFIKFSLPGSQIILPYSIRPNKKYKVVKVQHVIKIITNEGGMCRMNEFCFCRSSSIFSFFTSWSKLNNLSADHEKNSLVNEFWSGNVIIYSELLELM